MRGTWWLVSLPLLPWPVGCGLWIVHCGLWIVGCAEGLPFVRSRSCSRGVWCGAFGVVLVLFVGFGPTAYVVEVNEMYNSLVVRLRTWLTEQCFRTMCEKVGNDVVVACARICMPCLVLCAVLCVSLLSVALEHCHSDALLRGCADRRGCVCASSSACLCHATKTLCGVVGRWANWADTNFGLMPMP